jgi:hypothetical protein
LFLGPYKTLAQVSDGEYGGEGLYSDDDDDNDGAIPEDLFGSHFGHQSELEGDSYVTGHQQHELEEASADTHAGSGKQSLLCRAVDTTGHDHFGLHKPPPIYGHTAVLVPKRIDRGGDVDRMVVFGGYKYDDGRASMFQDYKTRVMNESDVEYLSEVSFLDLKTSLWHNVKCRGCSRRSKGRKAAMPEGRWGHTATMVGRKMWVYGGRGRGGRLMGDMWFIDCAPLGDEHTTGDEDSEIPEQFVLKWHQIHVTCAPPPRMLHAICCVHDARTTKLVMFGGKGGAKNADTWQGLGDLWTFDVTMALEGEAVDLDGDDYILAEYAAANVWKEPADSGHRPRPRFGHMMAALPDGGRIYIIGGCNVAKVSAGGRATDVIELDLSTWSWGLPHMPPVNGPAPPRYYGGCSSMVGGRYLLCFGGATVNPQTNEPMALELKEQQHRRHELDEEGDEIEYMETVQLGYVFDLGKNRWTTPQLVGAQQEEGHTQQHIPTARHSLSAVTVGHRVVIFGGTDDHAPNNGVFVMQLAEAP